MLYNNDICLKKTDNESLHLLRSTT